MIKLALWIVLTQYIELSTVVKDTGQSQELEQSLK